MAKKSNRRSRKTTKITRLSVRPMRGGLVMGGKKKKEGEAAKKPAKGGKKIDALFAKLDTNKDGSLSKDEFKKLHEAIQELKKDKKKAK